jgi:hypothetical protein
LVRAASQAEGMPPRVDVVSTLLVAFAGAGRLSDAQRLVDEKGAPIDAARADGMTALMVAAEEGHLHVVEYLAGEKGASVDVQTADGFTALMLAAANGNLDVVKYLAEKKVCKAPSNRATCTKCKENIAAGDWRIELGSASAIVANQGGRAITDYKHVACFFDWLRGGDRSRARTAVH